MRRAAYLTIVALLSWRAEAAWFPVFNPTLVQLRPGETRTLSVHGSWLSGIWVVPFSPMTFAAEDPSVATIEGSLPTTSMTTVQVTALQPGVTRIRVVERGDSPPFATSPLIVVAEKILPVTIETDGARTVRQPIQLKAVSAESDATYTWYWGPLGSLYTWEVGSGPELTVVPEVALVYDYSVLMTSSRGAGTATIALEIHEPYGPRRRATRH